MHLLIGLGNPGKDYARNRHNLGFWVIERIIALHGLGADRVRFQGITNEGTIAGEKVLALRPQTYMNLSGNSAGEAVRFFKIAAENIIAFYDELDLAFGKIRVKRGGGAAGHNGVKSLTQHLGPDFWRVRMGIAHPGERERVTGHVLGDFSGTERLEAEKMAEACARHIAHLLKGDEAVYMNRIANDLNPPRPSKPRQDPSAGGTSENA